MDITQFYKVGGVQKSLSELRPMGDIRKELDIRVNSGAYRELCITLNPKLWEEEQDTIIRDVITMTLNMYKCRYTLIPAISDNTNLHWHGVLQCTRKVEKKLKALLKIKIGRIRIAYIKNNQKYIDYVFDKHQRIEEIDDPVSLCITDRGRHIIDNN